MGVFFVGFIVSLGVMFIHPVGPGLVLLAVSPWESVLWGMAGNASNIFTPLPILAQIVRTAPVLWGQMFLGSRIQILAAIFIAVLALGTLMSVAEYGSRVIVTYLRHVAVIVIMGVIVWTYREPRHFDLSTRVLIISMTLVSSLALTDFFLGTSLLPSGDAAAQAGVVGEEFEEYRTGEFRFGGAGASGNRFANWLILPIFLSLGWAMSGGSVLARVVAFGGLAVMSMGVLATISRAAMLGLGVGGLFLLPAALRINPRQVVAIGAMGGVALSIAALIVFQTAVGEALLFRFSGGAVAYAGEHRFSLVMAGLKVFLTSPIWGVGHYGYLEAVRELMPDAGFRNFSHNTFISVLVEDGLLGFLPFMAVLILSLRQLSRRCVDSAAPFEYWRPFVRSALIAMLVQSWFNVYTFERFIWFCVAFAAVLERAETSDRMRRLRERIAGAPSFADPDPGAAGSLDQDSQRDLAPS
ncbi:MAG: O-antigen ligase family protein [Myxococcota bacterium]